MFPNGEKFVLAWALNNIRYLWTAYILMARHIDGKRYQIANQDTNFMLLLFTLYYFSLKRTELYVLPI